MLPPLTTYNGTMRPGMGFNSVTQEVGIYDAVKPLAQGSALFATQPPRTCTLGCRDIIRTASFVSQVSEVMEKLGISDASLVKQVAAGDGTNNDPFFFDTKTFLDSDVNYFIQVKVVCGQVIFPDLTEFSLVEGVSAETFTSLYGDSFISGFANGGEFNALVSIKLRDSSKAKDVRKLLAAYYNLQTMPQSDPQVKTGPLPLTDVAEVAIAVFCRGGGGIEDKMAVDWTLEALKVYSAEFPNHVKASPLQIYAMLTKYTNLDSFLKTSIKDITPTIAQKTGRPSVLTRALIDDYFKYKAICHELDEVIDGYSRTRSGLEASSVIPGRAALSPEDAELFADAVKKVAPSSIESLEPYKADIFGLEKASSYCKCALMQIAREMNDAIKEPKNTSNPDKAMQYLYPAIFRMLLPSWNGLVHQEGIDPKNDTVITNITDLWKLFCPASLDVPVQFLMKTVSKALDAYGSLDGIGSVKQYNVSTETTDQKWAIQRSGANGFLIRHIASGRYLAMGALNANASWSLTTRPVGAIFSFEPRSDNRVYVHLSEQPQYTMRADHESTESGLGIILWPGQKDDHDLWQVKTF